MLDRDAEGTTEISTSARGVASLGSTQGLISNHLCRKCPPQIYAKAGMKLNGTDRTQADQCSIHFLMPTD
jgi:hypothetical protein